MTGRTSSESLRGQLRALVPIFKYSGRFLPRATYHQKVGRLGCPWGGMYVRSARGPWGTLRGVRVDTNPEAQISAKVTCSQHASRTLEHFGALRTPPYKSRNER